MSRLVRCVAVVGLLAGAVSCTETSESDTSSRVQQQVQEATADLADRVQQEYATAGTYPDQPAAPQGYEMPVYRADADGVMVCLVHEDTHAWSLYDTARGGEVAAGVAGEPCMKPA